MQPRIKNTVSGSAFFVFLFALLAGCGGGGGGGSSGSTTSPPYIFAAVESFPVGAVPSGFLPTGFNGQVNVEVRNNSTGASIPNALVSLNGSALTYSAQDEEYEANIVVNPSQNLALRVVLDGVTYTASSARFISYPTISIPLTGSIWSSLAANLVAWTAVIPSTPSVYGLTVSDTSGNLMWPSSSSVQTLPTGSTSFTIPYGSLSAGNRLVIVALATGLEIPNAAPGSTFVLDALAAVPISVISTPITTLVSIAVTPASPTVTAQRSLQLTATGIYSDSSTQDLTSQVTWTSSNPAKATIDSAGLVTGVASGSTTITARLGTVSGSTSLNVFQPDPSPVPPLSQAVAYQIDYAHSGSVTFGAPLTFPSNPTWSVTLNAPAGYPLIAGGRVFVMTGLAGSGNPASLYALNKSTGAVIWGPLPIPGNFSWGFHAFDHEKIFVINSEGTLRSFDAATGQAGWSVQLPGQYSFSAPPTAVNGVVYVGGAGVGGTLYAIDESNGNILWTQGVANGQSSSPAVSSDGVFVSYPCQVYKFDPYSGASLWHYAGGCSGGGGDTPVYANGSLYVRDWTSFPPKIFDAATGAILGNFTSTAIPALTTQSGFYLNAGTLQGVNLSSHSVVWNFAGDGQLSMAPIVIDNTVVVGSDLGNLYALDGTTGAQIWTGYAGGPMGVTVTGNIVGIAAGEGYLIVPAGNVVTGWHLSGP